MPVVILILLIIVVCFGFYMMRRSKSGAAKRLDTSSRMSPPKDTIAKDPAQAVVNKRLSAMYAGDTGEYQKEETKLAIRVADEKFGRTLDYSHRSIADVEAILSGAHDYTQLGDAVDAGNLAEWADMFGCYMAAVIQKQTGDGQLGRESQDAAHHGYSFHWRGEIFWLQAWCHARIFDGPAYDVQRRYKSEVLDRIYRGKST